MATKIEIRIIYLSGIIMFFSLLRGHSQNIDRQKLVKYCLYSFYGTKDQSTAEIVERDFAMNRWDYPRILKKVNDSMLVTNPIVYASGGDAEYIAENAINTDEQLTKGFEIKDWDLIKFLGHELDYQGDEIKQLNYYDQKLYCLYWHNSRLNLVSYDTLTKTFNEVITLRDDIRLKEFINNIDFSMNENLLIISNSIIENFIVVDTSNGKAHYNKLPRNMSSTRVLGIKDDCFFFVESSDYTVRSFNYKNSFISSLGKLSYERNTLSDDTISYYLDIGSMLLYVSYFDFVNLCLVTSIYRL